MTYPSLDNAKLLGDLIHNRHSFLKTWNRNIAKGTTDPRVEFISQDHSTQFTDILNILQFQNLG